MNTEAGGPVTPSAPLPQGDADMLAREFVLWDGASDDGCAICGGEWDENGGPFVLHAKDCPVPRYRLGVIQQLVALDPPDPSPQRLILVQLIKAQARWEKVVFPL